jgi:hypothetical protein
MQLELQSPSDHIQSQLQRAVDLVAFGLHAADQCSPQHFVIPGVFGQITPTRQMALSVDAARDEFRAWVLANGFRECVEGVGTALEWVRKACFLWTRQGEVRLRQDGHFSLNARFSGEEWNEHIVKGAPKFDRLPLPDKLAHLERAYSWIRPDTSEDVLSLNAARNCLAHRDGVVGQKDVSATNGGLVIKWRTLHITVGQGETERVVDIGSKVEAGEEIGVRLQKCQRTIPLGEKVSISATEFVEIAMTFLFFSQELEKSVIEMQMRRRSDAG